MKRLALPSAIFLLAVLSACSRDPKVARQKYVTNGNKYFDRGKYKEASIMYRRALQKDLRYGEAWYRLGLTNLKLSIFGEARRDFVRAIDPGLGLPANETVDATAKLADLDLAGYLVEHNKTYLSEFQDMVGRLLKKDPNSYDGLRLKGVLSLTTRDLKDGVVSLEQANRVKPDQPEVVMPLLQALVADNRGPEAEKYAQDFIQRRKDYGPAYDFLYKYYVSTSHPEQGEAILKEKISNNPKQGLYVVQLAGHYFLAQRRPDMDATLARLTSDSKGFPEGHALVGDFYYSIRDYPKAIDQFEQGIKDQPKEKANYEKKLVQVYAVTGKTDQAAKLVGQLLKDDPKDSDMLAMHASLMLQGAKPEQAQSIISELQSLLAKSPNNVALRYNLARAYALKGDPPALDQAQSQLLDALKIRKNYVPAMIALAQLYLIRKDSPKALQTADSILAIDRNSLTARMIRTMSLIRLNELDKARTDLETDIKDFPHSTEPVFQYASLNFIEKKYPEAERDFDFLVKANDPRGFLGIVQCKTAEGKWPEAVKMLEDESKKSPNRADYPMALGEINYRAKHYKEAVAAYQDFNRLTPTADGYLRLGEAQRQVGDNTAAIASFNKARTLAPTDPMPTLETGMLLDDTGRREEALKLYQEVLKIAPDNPVALNNLAYAKADDGVDLDQALTLAEQARRKAPNNLDIEDTVALIYIRKNLTDDSLRLLKELVARDPDRATFHLHYAMALYQKGNRAEAKKELDAASSHKPTGREQERIKEMLKKVG